ncbi:transcription factor IBH1-like [Phragmites australis]|uniref:transcription factor IBH1-like n=1 Tax=Phragmites australis TaxID=29695 RepID=UPI002D78520D|nr:transcription factor IBH1-like [Phragmites australis]
MAAKRTAPPPANPNPNRRRVTSAADDSASAPPSKRMLAFHFLRALSRIHSSTPVPRRTRTIRRAAYSSMARAASPRSAWSRALLRQVRVRRAVRSRRAVLMRRRVSAAPAPPLGASRSSVSAGQTSVAPPVRTPPPRQEGEPARADALRQLIPGGNGMEYCSLLEETADYVRCLRAQVQLMQGLVDLFSGQ